MVFPFNAAYHKRSNFLQPHDYTVAPFNARPTRHGSKHSREYEFTRASLLRAHA